MEVMGWAAAACITNKQPYRLQAIDHNSVLKQALLESEQCCSTDCYKAIIIFDRHSAHKLCNIPG